MSDELQLYADLDLTLTPGAGDEWALVEIMGHRRYYGRVSAVERLGVTMLKIEVPQPEGAGYEVIYHAPQAIYGMRPMLEKDVRHALFPPQPAALTAATPQLDDDGFWDYPDEYDDEGDGELPPGMAL